MRLTTRNTSTAQRDRRRGSAHSRGYDKAWANLRKTYLSVFPLCERCLKAQRVTPAQDVHHIKPIAVEPDLRLSWSNLEALCRPCHNRHHHGTSGEPAGADQGS